MGLRTAIDAMMRRFKVAEIEVSDSKPLNQIDIQVMFYEPPIRLRTYGCGAISGDRTDDNFISK